MQSQLPSTQTIAAVAAGLAAARLAQLIIARDCDLRTLLARGDPRKFHGRVVWLASAHRPLSSALAHRLARLGACLVLSGPSASAPTLHALARLLGADAAGPCPAVVITYAASTERSGCNDDDDGCDGGTMCATARAAADEFGRLDLVVLDTTDVAPTSPLSSSHVERNGRGEDETCVDAAAAQAVAEVLPQLRLATGWGAAILHLARIDADVDAVGPLCNALKAVRGTERRVRVVDVQCGALVYEGGSFESSGGSAMDADAECEAGGVSDGMDAAAERVLAAVSGGLEHVVLGGVGERVALWARGWERGGGHEQVPLLSAGDTGDGKESYTESRNSSSSKGSRNSSSIARRGNDTGGDNQDEKGDDEAATETLMRVRSLMRR